ncbi:MAG: hypothetical protein K9J85_09615 [Desulfobacteraceae bacterium]|nr:hypothetical protein [Desulfobacteraceae bacterium]
MNDKALNITGKIEARLREGVRLGKDVVHYIESMTGVAGPEELVLQLKSDEESCDIESLYELIFYPG